jgi:ketosteroid isomerase-like protein
MAGDDVTDVTSADLDELLGIVAEGTSAFIGGDMRRYFSLIKHAEDYTLMAPTGGEVAGWFEVTDEVIEQMEQVFQSGEGTLEVVQTYASGALAVIVGIEHQHGVVGYHPEQDWSLRVTLVFRREGDGWRLVHRHADALVHPISQDQLAILARG